MALNNTAIIVIVIVIIVIILLLYMHKSNNNIPIISQLGYPNNKQNTNKLYLHSDHNEPFCHKCEYYKKQLNQLTSSVSGQTELSVKNPPVTSIIVENDDDPYSDPIKKQDLYGIYDPLTYPQLRLPRDILEKYNEYQSKTGTYPPFSEQTKPMFDNPILNGILIKHTDRNDPFDDNIPKTFPLMRVKSAKNTNRFFYYIIDQNASKIELKIPLDHIKINGTRYNNADFYGLPEIYDGDIIEGIPIYPQAKFKVLLYKTHHFP